ncbi:sugar transferase [Nocardioides sp.]|uniref:sugar transferase n=1 Tax=Nocardioides sp. TaxID=35761 RepID=UPI00378525F4
MNLTSYGPWKRLTDVVVSSLGIVITAPLQMVVAVVIRLRIGSPVLFRQERPGKDERIFTLIKFRTMLPPDPSRGPMTDAERMTALGSLLRSTSLDELPTLWNVFKGDMSLVGPRPLLVRYLDRYTPEQRRRHQVRPGVTGLAQVSGRNAITWEEKFAKDVEYVDRLSPALDLSIMVRTIGRVLRRDGIADSGGVSMAEFTGTGGDPRDA